ncbi:nitroreductase family protein [Saccharopolyspora sp. HNM0983]|uniref:Nitroreductase family protein n=1 Tax=Saccharopolyspora montiporae TaxID=2781240 RepID=A0A929BFP3_9PSEU|nr:nitroreductase family protein [Saccharopolyspora sp. HNM0983]
MSRKRGVAEERPFTSEEVETLAEAVRLAPSVHNAQPWTLAVDGRSATLHERSVEGLHEQDPEGRDRRISVGAAVADLALSVRALGWATDVRWHAEDEPGTATVIGTHRQRATVLDRERARAIGERASFRRPFAGRVVPHLLRTCVISAATVQASWIRGGAEERALARNLARAARINRSDVRYQRELGMWMSEPSGGTGFPADALAETGLPSVGLVGSGTRLPDQERLAEWIGQESVLVFSTLTDGPRDQLRVGMAVQRAWLEATRLGLVGSVLTQPLRLSEVRTELRDELGLGGIPQVLLRVGFPPEPHVPHAERRPLPQVFED